MIAYYSAKSNYEIFRESPTGKGFADMVFLPLPNSPFPAIVVELKYDKSAYGAIAQIVRCGSWFLSLRALTMVFGSVCICFILPYNNGFYVYINIIFHLSAG